MCDAIYRGSQRIDRVGLLKSEMGVDPVKKANYAQLPADDACLCGVDIPASLGQSGIDFYADPIGDYFICETGPLLRDGS